jgi:hypothetical protein
VSESSFALSSLRDKRSSGKKVDIVKKEKKTDPVAEIDQAPLQSEEAVLEAAETVLLKTVVDQLPSPSLLSFSQSIGTTLSGEVFFMDGFRADLMDYLTMLLVRGGGRRSFVMTDYVTKVLVGESTSNASVLLSSLDSHPLGVDLVSVTWLVAAMFPFEELRKTLSRSSPFNTTDSDWYTFSCWKSLCRGNVDSLSMPPPVLVPMKRQAPIRSAWLPNEDVEKSLRRQRQVAEKYGVLTEEIVLPVETTKLNSSVSSDEVPRKKNKTVDFEEESQIVVYKNSSFFNL